MNKKRVVLIGFLGTTLDRGSREKKRWNHWRPSVSLFQHGDLKIDRFEMLYASKFQSLADDVSKDIASVSPDTAVNLQVLETKDAWDFEEVYSALLDFARTYPFKSEKEEYLLHITTGTHVAQICLFLLAEARYFPARLIQTSPPHRTEKNPLGSYAIIDLDLSKYDRIASRFNKVKKDDLSFLKSGIETRNRKFNELIERIERVAIASKEPVLLLGPTGAGKSNLARKIFEIKRSRNQIKDAFVDVNCATIRGDGAMSALFGHTKGSFTGANQARDGLLLSAHGGILFLDEIGELGLDEQAMLLRAIEEKTFFQVGADTEVTSEFQLIAGTNRDLQVAVKAGQFREDLLARINLWNFKLPALRDRKEDIAPNIDYELERYSQKNNIRVSFNKEAHEKFLQFATSGEAVWAANFRDLSAAITRMATLADAGRISASDVEDEIDRLKDSWSRPQSDDGYQELCNQFGLNFDTVSKIDRFDRSQLLDVLFVCRSSRSLAEAGRQLFTASREGKANYNDADRLKKYLARFNVTWRGRSEPGHVRK